MFIHVVTAVAPFANEILFHILHVYIVKHWTWLQPQLCRKDRVFPLCPLKFSAAHSYTINFSHIQVKGQSGCKDTTNLSSCLINYILSYCVQLVHSQFLIHSRKLLLEIQND